MPTTVLHTLHPTPYTLHPVVVFVYTLKSRLIISTIICLLVLFSASSVHALWPLWWKLGDETNFLGPIASYEQKNGENEITVRPFLFSYTSENKGECFFLTLSASVGEKSYLVPFFLNESENSNFHCLFSTKGE